MGSARESLAAAHVGTLMIDLHCHILPGLDDGARDLETAVGMARAFVADGVETVACTPHILPGVYHNQGPAILSAVEALQDELSQAGVPLKLVAGADNHMVPGFVGGLQAGHLLTLAGSRYVLVEPPHQVAPPRLEEFFFGIQVAGYVPILTHPERLTWIGAHYGTIERLAAAGVWMQITAGSLCGVFGRTAQYWAERMLSEGRVHLLATDAHDLGRRRPELRKARDIAARRIGVEQAQHLVLTRPWGVLRNAAPASLPILVAGHADVEVGDDGSKHDAGRARDHGGMFGRLRRLIVQ